jgi:hypothetical protein
VLDRSENWDASYAISSLTSEPPVDLISELPQGHRASLVHQHPVDRLMKPHRPSLDRATPLTTLETDLLDQTTKSQHDVTLSAILEIRGEVQRRRSLIPGQGRPLRHRVDRTRSP